MDFPAYVPAAVRVDLSSRLDGDPRREIPGLVERQNEGAARLAQLEIDLKNLARSIAHTPLDDVPNADHETIVELRKEKAKQAEDVDHLREEVNCLQRLAHDTRMREAYAVLTREFIDDQQWREFIYAAYAARIDFERYRNRLKEAGDLRVDIAKAASKLARLLRQFGDSGVNGPDEFFSIPELLRKTDNHEERDRNLYMWRSMRKYVLGDLPEHGTPESTPDEPIEIDFVLEGDKGEVDPEVESCAALRYAWGTAPDLPALLDTVEGAARAFKPTESGVIGAAIALRQRSPKAEYLRAFGNLLVDVNHFTLNPRVMKAMGIVANVVINLPDVDVTYDDVRKTIPMPSAARQENSSEK